MEWNQLLHGCINLYGTGAIANAKLLKIAFRMRNGKLRRFRCLISLHEFNVENCEMFHFSCIYVTFCTNVIQLR